MPTSWSDVVLPEDVTFHILLWLPVMSLLRFKSVCKSWLALIESPEFINKHLRCHHHNPAIKDINYKLIVMNRYHHFDESGLHSGANLSLLSGDQFEVYRDIDLPGISKVTFPFINMVICDGIVCIYHYCEDYNFSIKECVFVMEIVLWNPATKQLTILPQSPFSLPLVRECYPPYVQFSVGFGFDVNANEYKVVRLTLFINYTVLVKSRAEVYNLSTDSWRIIDVSLVDITFIVSEPTTPYGNGTCYCWSARLGTSITLENDDTLFNHCIVSFDFTSDVFGTIPLPDDYAVKSDSTPQLYIIGDKIACISSVDYSPETKTGYFEIWLLNEYGVKESWTKLHKVGPSPRAGQVGLSRNGRCLLLVRDGCLWIYDLVNQDIKHLPFEGRHIKIDGIQVALYKESLVNIRRGNGAANTEKLWYDTINFP